MKFKRKKKKCKIFVLIPILATFLLIAYIFINNKEKIYYGAKNGVIFESKRCYLKKQIGYCEKDDKFVIVDYYYKTRKESDVK